MRDEKDVALAKEDWRQLGKPAGTPLAAVVPKDGGKWALAFRFVEEAVENEVATGKSDLEGRWGRLSESGCVEKDEESEKDCEG